MNEREAIRLERHCAAGLVQSARRALRRLEHEHASELLDWALLLVPRAQAVERLRIEVHIRENHLDAAEAMIARRLLSKPRDPLLLLMQVRCAYRRGQLDRAERLLSRVRALAPYRRDAIELAAEVALRLSDFAHAIDLHARLLARSPNDERIQLGLIRALIASGRSDNARHAERLLLLLEDPPPALLARSCMAQGRHRDAVDCLEVHVAETLDSVGDEHADAFLALYVQALETCGEISTIHALSERIDVHACPQTATALARVALAQGRFRAAARLSLGVLRGNSQAHHAPAASVAFVACTLNERTALARRIRAHFAARSTRDHPPPRDWIEAWRRGLGGRFLHEQRSTSGSRFLGGDPSPSVLRPLLRRAAKTLASKLHTSADDANESQIEHDLATCHAALGSA